LNLKLPIDILYQDQKYVIIKLLEVLLVLL